MSVKAVFLCSGLFIGGLLLFAMPSGAQEHEHEDLPGDPVFTGPPAISVDGPSADQVPLDPALIPKFAHELTKPPVLVGTPGTSVDEAGLPARGGESAGSAAATNSETTTGSFSFTNGDGASTLTIGGQSLVAGNSYTGDYGTLTVISIVGTTVNYSYTLTDNVNHTTDPTPYESFVITVSDSGINHSQPMSGRVNIRMSPARRPSWRGIPSYWAWTAMLRRSASYS